MTDNVHTSSDSTFSIGSMKNILKSVTDKKVAKNAANKLGKQTEEKGKEIAEKATKIAEEKGRKTVRKEDIRDALQ